MHELGKIYKMNNTAVTQYPKIPVKQSTDGMVRVEPVRQNAMDVNECWLKDSKFWGQTEISHRR